MSDTFECLFCGKPCAMPGVYEMIMHCANCRALYFATSDRELAHSYQIALSQYKESAELAIKIVRNPCTPSEDEGTILILGQDIDTDDLSLFAQHETMEFPFGDGTVPFIEIKAEECWIGGKPPTLEKGDLKEGTPLRSEDDFLLFFCRANEDRLFCPHCWRRVHMPLIEEYNVLFTCPACGNPYLIFDATGPHGDFDPEEILAKALGMQKSKLEYFTIRGFDLSVNAKTMGMQNLVIGTARWGQWCTFYAARKKRQGWCT